jgi:putative ABC transport system permease protein
MIRSNISVYFKILAQHKLSFLINFFGLSIALTAAFLMYVYIRYESGYDRQLGEQVYRISLRKQEQGKVTYHSAKSYTGLVHLLKEVPAVQSATRILYEQCLFRLGDKKLPNQQVYWADSAFADVFGLHLLKGAGRHLLASPHEAIISRAAAVKLFGPQWQGREDLLGATLLLNEGLPFRVVGVFETYPGSSHLAFDYVLSFSTLTAVLGKGFGEMMPPGPNLVYTYVTLHPKGDHPSAQAQLNALLKKRAAPQAGVVHHLDFQPARGIHLDSHLADELTPNASRDLLGVLELVAGLIILIALINYLNLSVSMATKRVREVGMRKVLGATPRQLIGQFAGDSVLSFLIVFGITALLVKAFAGPSYGYLEVQIPDSYYYSGELWRTILFFAALVTLVPAGYLGLLMTQVKPLSAGVHQTPAFGKVGMLRKGLVVVQFVASTFLIASTGVVYRQVNLMQQYHLGYDQQNVVVVKSPRTLIGNPERENLFEVFKARLQALPGIERVASGSVIPGEEFLIRSGSVKRTGTAPLAGQTFRVGFTDGDFLGTLGIKLAAGRTFGAQRRSKDAIINRRALPSLGFSSPQEALGQQIGVLFEGDKRTIVGVAEDYHHLSVHTLPTETIFLHGPDYEFGYYPIRLHKEQLQSTLGAITQTWQALFPNDPFDYFFLDNFFGQQYASEVRFGRAFFGFSGLAILISCLGLLGVSLYSTELRQREVCIRKVFGASTLKNVLLLSREYLILVLSAIVIAVPLIVFFSDRFLRSFPYRVEQQPFEYLLSGAGVVLISLVTILYNVVKVSGKNPAQVLRNA